MAVRPYTKIVQNCFLQYCVQLRNRFYDLGDDLLEPIVAQSEGVDLQRGDVLFESGDDSNHLYTPTTIGAESVEYCPVNQFVASICIRYVPGATICP